MPNGERISRDIREDIEKMKRLLVSLEDDPRRYEEFFRNTMEVLREFQIDIEKYSSRAMSAKTIQAEIVTMTKQVVESNVMARLKPIIDMVAATSYSQSTETSYEYNFDNSSSSDYKYESHTGTERGTFSETSTGSAVETDTRFSAISALKIYEMLRGPLISDLAIQKILTAVTQTLDFAATKRGGY